MLAIALTTLLLTASDESGTKVAGFAGKGLGVEVTGSFAKQAASGDLESRGILWELSGPGSDSAWPGEYLRGSVGLDIVIGHHFAFGPWFRGGFGSSHDIDPTSTFLATYRFGLRLSTALP